MGNLNSAGRSFGPRASILAVMKGFNTKSVMVSDVGLVPDEHGKKIVRAGTIVGGIGGSVMLNQDLLVAEHGYPSLRTSLAGPDNDLLFAGLSVAAVTIEYVVPAASTPLSVAVAGNDIVVTLATNTDGVVVSTANDVKNAVNSYAAASALVVVRNIVSDSGNGLVTAMPQTALVVHNSVNAPEGLLFNDVDVTNGPFPGALLYVGSVEISAIPRPPTAAQIAAPGMKDIRFMDYRNRKPVV